MLGFVGGPDSSRRLPVTASSRESELRRRARCEPGAPSRGETGAPAGLFVDLTLSLNGALDPVLSVPGRSRDTRRTTSMTRPHTGCPSRLSRMSDRPASASHDPELSRFLDALVDLAATRHQLGPDAFIAELDQRAEQFRRLLPYRTERALTQRLSTFARRRFELVDDASEYALATEEVMLLSTALQTSAKLAFPALKDALELLSGKLGEEGVVPLFGRLLKHTRQLARQHGDAELSAWVQGVVNALPDE